MAAMCFLSCLALISGAYGCGMPASTPASSSDSKVAVPRSWPWHVSLQNNDGLAPCSGALINSLWVVTAAHCHVTTDTQVILGQSTPMSRAKSTQVKAVSKVIKHPIFNDLSFHNDISLLKLSSNVAMNARVSPVSLPGASDALSAEVQCVATGSRNTSTNSNANAKVGHLQQKVACLLSNTECSQAWGADIPSSIICATTSRNFACVSDYRGALVCPRDRDWVLAGVQSVIPADCGLPSVFTRVSEYISWIKQTVASN